MTIQENGYQKAGRNNLASPQYLIDSAVHLKLVQTLIIDVRKPFSRLYTLWKPSHFFTGLEIHSTGCSWRTFRIDKLTFAAVKMYLQGDSLTVEVFANIKSTLKLMRTQQPLVWTDGIL